MWFFFRFFNLKEQLIQTVEIVVCRLIFQVAHALLSFVMRISVKIFFPTYCLHFKEKRLIGWPVMSYHDTITFYQFLFWLKTCIWKKRFRKQSSRDVVRSNLTCGTSLTRIFRTLSRQGYKDFLLRILRDSNPQLEGLKDFFEPLKSWWSKWSQSWMHGWKLSSERKMPLSFRLPTQNLWRNGWLKIMSYT